MKYLAVLLGILIFTMVPRSGETQPPPVISANGFSCSSAEGVVNCKGAFPGHASPILTALGFGTVGLLAQYPDHVWKYQSDTGCLCKMVAKSMECTSQAGGKKSFQGPDAVANASTWCRQGL